MIDLEDASSYPKKDKFGQIKLKNKVNSSITQYIDHSKFHCDELNDTQSTAGDSLTIDNLL